MINVCILGAHKGRLKTERKLYVTLMAACELQRPTMAQLISAHRNLKEHGESSPPPPAQFFLTLLGSTALTSPTLMHEYTELQTLVDEGTIELGHWDRAMAVVSQFEQSLSSSTLLGAFAECELPSENAEIDALAVQLHLGTISEEAGDVLKAGIGLRDAERRSVILRALDTAEAETIAL